MKYAYTVTAYRWGDREKHSYVVGVYTRDFKAIKAADVEQDYRGGKYACEVLRWSPDKGMEGKMRKRFKVIIPLPEKSLLEAR